MKDGLFHFKRFSVSHSASSMKVGVDGVLIGMWASCGGSRILDAGTGCGVIALMLAQRNLSADIVAIDIDMPSVEEASLNFRNSPWSDRLSAGLASFNEINPDTYGRFDAIVSNPPFFDSGIRDLSTSRNRARHEGDFSPESLISHGPDLLTAYGTLAMIVPEASYDKIMKSAVKNGLALSRCVYVRDHAASKIKRVMMEFRRSRHEAEPSVSGKMEWPILTLFAEDGSPTDEYRELGKDFYLRF